jgi:anthranilate synthase component 1
MLLAPVCRVDNERIVTNRPLAGTRRRGATPEADKALEQDLLADQKEVRRPRLGSR